VRIFVALAALLATSLVASAQPVSQVLSVTNAACWEPGIVAGSLATAFVAGIVPPGTNIGIGLPYPTSLGGVTVTVATPGGKAYLAPILYVGYNNGREQINFQAPWEVTESSDATATITVAAGSKTATVVVPLLESQPGIYVGNQNFAAAFYGAQALTSDNPARAGQMIYVMATGLGPVYYPQVDGVAAPYYGIPYEYMGNFITHGFVTVTIGETTLLIVQPAETLTGTAGIYQVGFEIPAGLATGLYPIQIQLNGAGSNLAMLPIAAQ